MGSVSAMIIIDGYQIDIATSESITLEATVSEHPIERGSAITDHVSIKPTMLSVTGMVSDTPIGDIASQRANPLFITDLLGGALPSVEAYDKLWDVLQSREPVTIETDTRVYDNMVMYSLSLPRDGTGESLNFTAAFKRIEIIASDRRRIVPVAVPIAKKKAKKGTKPAKEIDVAAMKKTIVNSFGEDNRGSVAKVRDAIAERL